MSNTIGKIDVYLEVTSLQAQFEPRETLMAFYGGKLVSCAIPYGYFADKVVGRRL